jgi:electron transfer flavoprotein beta subunit
LKIVVCAKQTFDTEAVISLDANGQINSDGITLILDPYSEFAVEEAIRMKEKHGGEVVILTIGKPSAQTAVRHCLAMGADSAILITDPALDGGDASATAAVLAKALQKLNPDIILGGFKSADIASAQVMPRIAEIMNIPHVNVVTKIELENGKAVATREIDDGVELIEVTLPAIFTAQQGLAEPRYPSVKGIMQSKKKPITNWTLADVGVDSNTVGAAAAKVKVLKYTLKEARKGGRIIEGEVPDVTAEVVKLTRTEAKVI